MDKSYEFKRKSLYWYSVLNTDSDSAVHGYSDETTLDRYSALSSILFNRLLSFESLVSPYTILTDEQSFKTNPYGTLSLPKNVNLSSYIRSKRAVFNKIGIDAIVHDTKVIGELINQIEETLDSGVAATSRDTALRQHREGINSCLKYLFQSVKDHVQNYQRFRLKFESSMNSTLRVMSENLSEARNVDESSARDNIPNSYLSHFVPASYEQSHFSHVDHSPGQAEAEKSGYASPDPNGTSNALSVPKTSLKNATLGVAGFTAPAGTARASVGSLKFEKGAYNIATHVLDPSEMQDEQVSGALEQQHARTVNSINDQLKASELRAINSVQERLTEISSMFVKLTGTVDQQNELHEIINANVQESISNIEKTQDTLKRTSKEALPFYHRILCLALIGLSVFLLFVDYLKSSKGAYLF